VRRALAGLLLAAGSAVCAAAEPALLRFDDDQAALRAQCGDAFCPKALALGERISLSLGGEGRWRHELTDNPDLGASRQDRGGAWLQRSVGFADLGLDAHWRVFAQLSAAREAGRAEGPSPVDENRLEWQNAFLEWHDDIGAARLMLRAGEQELRFGSARLIDVREGPNVRRRFVGTRAQVRWGDARLDVFYLRPRIERPGRFDDPLSDVQRLRGGYATWQLATTGLDLYALDFRDRAVRFVQGRGDERRWTLGARAFGQRHGWDWNWEAALQGGRFGSSTIRAWTLASDTGYTFAQRRGQPRLGLMAAVASGDGDAGDDRLGTFNPLYPRGNYFGEDATLGPRNFVHLQPTLRWAPGARITLSASLNRFWRQRATDGVYRPNGAILRAPEGSRTRHVADVTSASLAWTPAPRWTLTHTLAYLRPGTFLRETGPAQPIGFVETTLLFRF
jgi:hypothetical protein